MLVGGLNETLFFFLQFSFKAKDTRGINEMESFSSFSILTMQHFNRHINSLLKVSFYVADFK